ncbi:RNA binding protein [Nannizzia gypsea CBS 118893]|uniref:RNA binding protein n=1 Tax=Arthroderma gypseum (strain ATCC MYA-4604 / CBS 118893) TaxID=535722 RepID=E4USW5_ARTGP|nr:RNA binding protein [Nannizzia gypsea CBS 118893]EFR01414.1 RNA binding protein [Nannizzia gypsea CBS 118893]
MVTPRLQPFDPRLSKPPNYSLALQPSPASFCDPRISPRPLAAAAVTCADSLCEGWALRIPTQAGVAFENSLQRRESLSTGLPRLSLATTKALAVSQGGLASDIFASTSQASTLAASIPYSITPIGKPSSFDSRTPVSARLGQQPNGSTACSMGNGQQSQQQNHQSHQQQHHGGATAVRMRMLPRNTSYEALRSMLLFAKNLLDAEFIPNEYSEDSSFLTAVALFETRTAAEEAQAMLNGKPNSTNDANMIVEIVSGPSTSAMISRRNTIDHLPRSLSMLSPTSPHPFMPSSRMLSRLDDMHSLDNALDGSSIGKQSSASTTNGELPAPDTGSRIHSLFSSQSPAGNGMNDRPRVSGKSVIDQDVDEDTGELLKDPIAYARNGPMALQRRSTNPQLPMSQFSNLSLTTNMSSPPLAPFSAGAGTPATRNMPTPTSAVSTFSGSGSTTPYHQLQFHRLNYPPVNPADPESSLHSPVCRQSTARHLEDELKALFSSQRGYKRIDLSPKSPTGPSAFVEFEDVSFATKCLTELYGYELSQQRQGRHPAQLLQEPPGASAMANQAASTLLTP